jgi:glycine/D-amino acid oxidase-like deaminating enzyme
MGVSCAHHLHERGVSVRLVERDGIAQATSTCGAGFIAFWGGGYVPQWESEELVACERYGIDFYTALHAELPVFPFRSAGSLYLATTDEGWELRLKPIAESTTVPGRQVLDGVQAAEAGQIVRSGSVVGGVFDPDPVQVVARDAVRAMTERLRGRAVPVDEQRPVTRLTVADGRVRGVQTLHGDIAADAVVLAVGMWANRLLAPHGAWLPYAAMGALRITTEPLGIPPTMPMLLVPEVGAWVREQEGALLWGAGYGGRHRTAWLDVDPPERPSEMPMDGLWETQRIGAQLASVLPPLGRYHDFTYAEGAPCYTPDLLPLIGELSEIDGVYALGGDSEAGITHGPAFGRALAEAITGSEPFVSLERFRPDRFGAQFENSRQVADAIAQAEGGVFH